MSPSPPPTSPEIVVPDGPSGLLLSRDLIFTTKVVGTARALGRTVVTAGGPALVLAHLGRWIPRVVFADLSAGDLITPEAIACYREMAPGVPFVAFGSHVDAEALAAASRAGCDPVLPRSRFSAELPALIDRYLGDSGTES